MSQQISTFHSILSEHMKGDEMATMLLSEILEDMCIGIEECHFTHSLLEYENTVYLIECEFPEIPQPGYYHMLPPLCYATVYGGYNVPVWEGYAGISNLMRARQERRLSQHSRPYLTQEEEEQLEQFVCWRCGGLGVCRAGCDA